MNQPLRLAFAGASGTGKSTLAKAVSEAFKLPMCPVGSREVSKSMGFDSPYDVDAAGKRGEFQTALLEQKHTWECQHLDGGFVTDRTPLDNLTYTLGHDPALGNSTAFRQRIINAMLVYNRIVFCPISSFHDVAGDPSRVADLDYHLKYEEVLSELLGKFNRGIPVLRLTATDRETRLQMVMEFVR